uniref:Uncharacterized protein n=1 Tax=Kalanchoe fedtschenkoi TaxID=63787 RepID=A0A7N0UTB1_KALFE
MAALQKFKLFATQCAAVNIPTQSPTTSPLLHLRRRRRKTLRMLLTRRSQISDSLQPPAATHKRLKLKDLFSSATPAHRIDADGDREEVDDSSEGIRPIRIGREIGSGPVRPVSHPFGCRNKLLLRRAWRPVLTTIEETLE